MIGDNIIENINPQPTKENPLTVFDYPYGFRLRTQAQYYIESNQKGQRVIFRTLNPKTNRWNNFKKSIYSDVLVLYKNLENNHIENDGLSFAYDDDKKLDDFLSKFQEVLSDFQKERVKVLRAIIKTRKFVKVDFVSNPTEQEQKKIEKNNEEVNEQLRKIFYVNLKREKAI